MKVFLQHLLPRERKNTPRLISKASPLLKINGHLAPIFLPVLRVLRKHPGLTIGRHFSSHIPNARHFHCWDWNTFTVVKWANGHLALHPPVMQSDWVSLPVWPQVSHSRVSGVHKQIYSCHSNIRNLWSWCLREERPKKEPPHNLHVGKSLCSQVFGSCCVSQGPFTYRDSSHCTLCYSKDRQFTTSCLSGLSLRAQSASWTAVYKPSCLQQMYYSIESWTWDVESAGRCHEFFSIRSASKEVFRTLPIIVHSHCFPVKG